MISNDSAQDHTNHQSRLASVGQIAAGIAHEVRNPLTAVKGFLQLLDEKAPHTYINIAQQELDNAISILQNLLNVSKPDLDDEEVSSIYLCNEMDALLDLFQDQFYRVTIHKEYKDDKHQIFGKKNQLKRAFFNILKNAFEAIEGKGDILIAHYVEKNVVHLAISDSGTGIPNDKLNLLGTPFFTTKSEGTGMGLAYVFSTVYQHGGKVSVSSVEDGGTTFAFEFPIEKTKEKGVVIMNLTYEQGHSLKDFLSVNKNAFEEMIFNEAVNIKDIMQEIKMMDSIDLLSNAHKLVAMLVDNRDLEIVSFAQQEGKLWAMHSSLNLAVKLEWFQAISRVLWDFIYNFERLSEQHPTREQFFALERQINTTLDIFLRHFFMSYTMYKDELIQSQQKKIIELSVPIIPLSSTISILPLLGGIDIPRTEIIQEKVLQEISMHKIRILLIDLSGVALLDTSVIRTLFKLVEGISYMGCRTIVTGIRPEIASAMISLDHSYWGKIETKGTLQQALEELGIIESGDAS